MHVEYLHGGAGVLYTIADFRELVVRAGVLYTIAVLRELVVRVLFPEAKRRPHIEVFTSRNKDIF